MSVQNQTEQPPPDRAMSASTLNPRGRSGSFHEETHARQDPGELFDHPRCNNDGNFHPGELC